MSWKHINSKTCIFSRLHTRQFNLERVSFYDISFVWKKHTMSKALQENSMCFPLRVGKDCTGIHGGNSSSASDAQLLPSKSYTHHVPDDLSQLFCCFLMVEKVVWIVWRALCERLSTCVASGFTLGPWDTVTAWAAVADAILGTASWLVSSGWSRPAENAWNVADICEGASEHKSHLRPMVIARKGPGRLRGGKEGWKNVKLHVICSSTVFSKRR